VHTQAPPGRISPCAMTRKTRTKTPTTAKAGANGKSLRRPSRAVLCVAENVSCPATDAVRVLFWSPCLFFLSRCFCYCFHLPASCSLPVLLALLTNCTMVWGLVDAVRIRLESKNDVHENVYEFQTTVLKNTQALGTYSDKIFSACEAIGMLPVCDNLEWCQTDVKALYIGQVNEWWQREVTIPSLSLPSYRRHEANVPKGFEKISMLWDGLCSYTALGPEGLIELEDRNETGRPYKDKALCNIPTRSSNWYLPQEKNPGFVCGRVGAITAIDLTASFS